MFRRFYPHTSEANAERFCTLVRQHTDHISAAQIQGYFLFHKDNDVAALENIERIKNI